MKKVVVNQIKSLEKLCILPVTYETLKEFCVAAFEHGCRMLNIESSAVSFSFQRNPLSANGSMRCLKRDAYNFYVIVNLWHNLHRNFNDDYERYFYACVTVLHELFHIRLQIHGSDNNFDDYLSFLSYIEETGRFSRNFGSKFYAMLFSQVSLNHGRYRYFSNPEEICCIRYGYLSAYSLLQNVLNQYSSIKIEKICESIELIYNNIEACYIRKSQPISLLAKCYCRIVTAVEKNHSLLQQYPLFSLFIEENGSIRNLQGIYSIGKRKEIDFLDDIVVRFFMWEDENELIYNKFSEEMYADIEQWANSYIEKGVDYLQKQELAEVVLPPKIIEDNAALIIKNIDILNQRMLLLGMKHNGKNIVPLYRIS